MLKEMGDVWYIYVDGADEVLVASQKIGQTETKDDCEEPCSYEALDGFLRADLDQLSATKGDTTDVGEDVVCDDQGGW